MAGVHKSKWFEFSNEQIKLVESMAGAGLTDELMGAILGISLKTFNRAIKKNAEAKRARASGKAKAVYNVASTLYQMAVSGKNPAATFFYLKTQGGFRETNRTELVGENGKPIETKSEMRLTIRDYREDK